MTRVKNGGKNRRKLSRSDDIIIYYYTYRRLNYNVPPRILVCLYVYPYRGEKARKKSFKRLRRVKLFRIKRTLTAADRSKNVAG